VNVIVRDLRFCSRLAMRLSSPKNMGYVNTEDGCIITDIGYIEVVYVDCLNRTL